MSTNQRAHRPDRRRYAAALHVAGGTIRGVAKAAGLAERYVHDALAGQCSLSERMAEALRLGVGDDGWRYACGLTDTLPCPGERIAA